MEFTALENYKHELRDLLKTKGKTLSPKELYEKIAHLIMKTLPPDWNVHSEPKTKRASYLSMEFLIGRMIYSNLSNLNILTVTIDLFNEHGLDFYAFETIEDCALGNGGLGRLAACFLDSAATHNLPLDGYGIRYRYGLFKQYFDKGFQNEVPDNWLKCGDPFSIKNDSESVVINFRDMSVLAVPYDMPIIGYSGDNSSPCVNRLRLWEAQPLPHNEFNFESFNNGDYSGAFENKNSAEAISCVLYPNDETRAGKILRIKQEYFFTSASLQSMMRDFKRMHNPLTPSDWNAFSNAFSIQLNDTHPAVAVPELIRLLQDENLSLDEAFVIAQKTLNYTNHTIMQEALEKWDVDLFCDVVPEVYPYIVMVQNLLKRSLLDKGITNSHKDYNAYQIIEGGRIHMARLAVFGTNKTNGVASLHTDILKKETLKEWHTLYPDRIINKTNGITQRRWLLLSNPLLSEFISERIGKDWITDLTALKKLEGYKNDTDSLKKLMEIKRSNKQRLYWHVKLHEYNKELNLDSIFDVQIKRLHEYKRQLLNAFSIIDLYLRIKDGELKDLHPMTFIFGAKAAPGYYRAKGIIKLINEIGRVISEDKSVCDKLDVLFVQNYNVSYAEKIIPASDISEQISTAGTEASGTGNMKLMLNGALTLGTYDGANVEIVREAGIENAFIFGKRVEGIESLKQSNSYNPREIYETNPRIKRILDTLVDGTFNDESDFMFKELYASILDGASWHKADHYFLLADLEDYVDKKIAANKAYTDRENWSRMCLLNIANAGYFSSDRTVAEYAKEIWGI